MSLASKAKNKRKRIDALLKDAIQAVPVSMECDVVTVYSRNQVSCVLLPPLVEYEEVCVDGEKFLLAFKLIDDLVASGSYDLAYPDL